MSMRSLSARVVFSKGMPLGQKDIDADDRRTRRLPKPAISNRTIATAQSEWPSLGSGASVESGLMSASLMLLGICVSKLKS